MDRLPDFSRSKLELKGRIEGALRERKRNIFLHHLTLFVCMFIFTTSCTFLYIRNLLTSDSKVDSLLLSASSDSDFVIQLPKSFSLKKPGDITLINKSDLKKSRNE